MPGGRALIGVLLAAGSLSAGCGGPGPRPVAVAPSLPATAGPALLREPVGTAAQLTDGGGWPAPPILVSGASAYRDGEFLYQGYLFDDHGAAGLADPGDAGRAAQVFGAPAGTYSYPTGPGYDGNAADLVELRIRPVPGGTAVRVTLNTLVDPALVAFTVALGRPGSPAAAYPFGAGVSGPAEHFLTVHGEPGLLTDTAVLTDTAGTPAPDTPAVAVDLVRSQITVTIPHGDWDPGTSKVVLAAGVGLWDGPAGRFLVPQGAADAGHPGGARGLAHPEAFFDVAFRGGEPVQAALGDPAWWRESLQARSLAAGTIAPFSATVDFGKLARATTDDSAIPTSGPMDRILASHFSPGPGVDFGTRCGTFPAECQGEYRGDLQPYALEVPARHGSGPYGLTLLLHGAGADYNEFLGSRQASELAGRGTGSLVVTPEARGPDGFYDGLPEADVFEVWADMAAHYRLDPAFTVISGYSMGGVGTFKLAVEYPDLFAAAQPDVGTGALVLDPLFPSLRNIPVLMWNAGPADFLVPPWLPAYDTKALVADGLRFSAELYPTANHLTFDGEDQYAPAVAFLGTATVDPDPAHVTDVVTTAYDKPADGLVADHAYWLSGLRLRNPAPVATAVGRIDAVSKAFGTGDPVPSGAVTGSGTLTGGNLGPISYTSTSQTWGPTPTVPRADELDITATNLSAVTVDVGRARLDCRVVLHVTTDGPLSVTLPGCGAPRVFGG